MATIKYDNSKVETRKQAQPGVHLFKIVSVRDRTEEGKQDIEVVLEVSEGKDKGARVWAYLGLTEATAWKFRQFTDALGLPPKGTLNTAKLVGKPVGGLITEDTWDSEYRARLKTFLDPEKVGADEEGEDLDDVTEDEGDEVDLDALDLDELKELIEEEELDLDADEIIGRSKGARAEAKLRAAIQEFYDAQEEEGDEDDDEDDDEDEDEDGEESYEDMDLSDLVALAKERGIKLTVKERKDKQVVIDKLEEADEADEADDDEDEDEEPEPPAKKSRASAKPKVAGKPAAKAVAADEDDDEEEEQEDYSDWDEDDLREELESRGLSVKGTKKVMITRLERDDNKSGTKPF